MSSSYRKLKRTCYQRNRFCGECSRKRDAPRFKAPAVQVQQEQEQQEQKQQEQKQQEQKQQEHEQEQKQEDLNQQQQAPTPAASALEDTQDAVTEGIRPLKPAEGLRGFLRPAVASMELQRTFTDLSIEHIENWLVAEIEAEKLETAEFVISAIPSHYHNRREEFLGVCKKIAGKKIILFPPIGYIS